MISLVTGSLLFAYAGMLGLCQGLERHYKQVWQRSPSPALRLILRALGWLGLLLSLLLCAQAWGWAMGAVAWFGVISLAAVLLVMLLPYWPRFALALVAAIPAWGVLHLLG
ncbi:DUF3325 domain-containing protein [Pseudomonas shirazensis]|uniref:DUF3325 domain-containing protein n=1 Tax=Pseudomonas shirazensis TaxID=2745494 RepID=UPI003D2B5301